MQASSSPASQPDGQSLLKAFADWARTDGLVWLYLFKTIAAALIALGVAMKLELPSPRTAMTTVFIVMQPQSGPVFAKSFYRLCGTLVGLVVMLALIGLFAQQPELFIATTAMWVGICTAGAARNRNFRSYGFVLAGYTAALIGIPASQHPDGAFMSAMTRVAEISIGILTSGVVSAIVFPQYTGELLRSTVRRRFASFVDYVSASLAGRIDRSQIEATNARFVADIVGFETSRSNAVFETPDSRMRSGRLARLNTEFMAVSTRFHALHQLMNRLRSDGSTMTVDALEPYFREIAPLFENAGERVLTAADAAHASAQLSQYRAALPRRVRETRAQLKAALTGNDPTDTAALAHKAARLLDFDTATELFYRFVHEMNEYTATYASLAVDTHSREKWIARYVPKTNMVAASVQGVRAAIVMGLLGAFWIATAWPSGTTLVLTAAATCALASASPQPTRMASQMAIGTALASLVGLILTFGVFPHIDGFPMLCVALAPALALGTFITTRPKYVGIGVGYCIFLCFLAGPDNLIQYDPTSYINDAIALVMAMIVSAAAFAVLLPPSTPWLRNRLLANLRGQAVHACRSRLQGLPGIKGGAGLRNRFESGARDLMFQLNALAGHDETWRQDTLRWMFATLEIGNAAIDLREELASLPSHPRFAKAAPWRAQTAATLKSVAALFEHPDARRHAAALATTTAAIGAAQVVLEDVLREDAPREERHPLQRCLSHLHFIRTALIDPQSPFAAYAATGAGADTNHPSGKRPGDTQGANHAS
ncbi:putative membrane protein YccC [Paraburkholderia eburnea]|uniref:Putative membrane protein YccC n=1 Tax=Paraburkholderia eburnea TaxID=1189126 RepID=A0A2S4LUQ3_9BURK|nr:FUSC family protein [Paraburkholderia eburnea]POR46168.1 putative membrane protein YccC [Paraburkholderia eburnea]PRZ25887.1 putative membrane protein YccC [Paraburkholderia eburnea]